MEKKERDVLRDYLSVIKVDLGYILFLSVFINVLMLLPSIYMLAVYDIVIPSSSVSTLVMITVIVLILYGINTGLQAVREKMMIRLNNRIDKELNQKVVDINFRFAVKHPSIASIQPFSDFQQIKTFLSSATVIAFFDMPWVPVYLGVLYLFHPSYFVFSVLVVVISFLLTIINEYATKKYLNKANEYMSKSNKQLTNIITNAEIIHAMGMGKNIYRKWYEVYKNQLYNFQLANEKNALWSNLSKNFRILVQSLILGLGGYLAIKGEISGGMVIAGSIVLGRALAPMDVIISTWKNFSSFRFAYKKLNSLFNEFDKKVEVVKLPEPAGEITLRGVSVAPPDTNRFTVVNLVMQIKPGEMVAVVGPSGAGKTSLVKAILGVWPVAAGAVEIDGADLRQWDREYLGKMVGYLPQDIELFEGTIAENIARFEENFDENKVIEAAVLAGCHDMIVKLPDGYNTYVGPSGITLSGGQRQRVALARAVYGNPRIVVLDEPNSNLDDAGETALFNTLVKLKQNKTTTIIITHKLNVLQFVDKIAVMTEGRLVMYGDSWQVLEQLTKKG